MPRDGSGNFALPANTLAVSGDAISSTKYNSLVQDLESDANVDRPVAAGGTGASTASAARTNLGLAIGTDVQAFDAGLLSIAGLTTAADRSIYTTASDTYAVYTLTAAGRAILDDADASAQRTTLGLAIGTDVQAYNARLAEVAGLTPTDSGFIVGNGSAFVLETGATVQASLGYTAADVLTKLLTVDGAGSLLDADTVDGIQASALVQTTGTQTVAGVKTFSNQLNINYSGSPALSITDAAGGGNIQIKAVSGTLVFVGSTNNVPLAFYANNAEVGRFDVGGGLTARISASSETTGTLTVASANKTIQATGDITIPNAVFSAGDIILIYAGASSRTITQGASVTMRLGGTATTGSRTLAARGVAMLFFVSSSEVIVSGGAVT